MASLQLREEAGGYRLSAIGYQLMAVLPLLILLAAFALYLASLDAQSFWRDEALSILRARQPWSQQWRNLNIIDGAAGPDLHPPLYFMLLKLWQGLLGESEFTIRLFSVFSQLLALATTARLAKAMGGRLMQWVTLFLAALSPFLWWYAQEARMYALLFFLGNLLLLLLWRLLKKNTPTLWQYLGLFLLGLMLVAVHYSGAFLLAFIILALLLRQQNRLLLAGIGGVGLLLVIVVTLATLDSRLFELNLSGLQFSTWQKVINDALRTFSLGSSQASYEVSWELLPFLILAGAALGGTAQAWWRQRDWNPALFSIAGFLIMSAIFVVGGIVQVDYANPRHLTLMAPFWFLTLGLGMTVLWRLNRPISLILLALISWLGCSALDEAINQPPQIRDDMRGLSQYLEPRLQDDDIIIFHDAAMMAIYEIYALPDIPAKAVPASYMSDDTLIRQTFHGFSDGHNRLWFVSGLMGETGVSDILIHEWVRQDMVSFDAAWSGLHLSLYSRALRDDALPAAEIVPAQPWENGSITIYAATSTPARRAQDGIWWSLYWSRPNELEPPADSTTCLRLTDTSGTVWSEQCLQLFHQRGNYGQQLFKREFWLPYPEGLPPVSYDVKLVMPALNESVATITIEPTLVKGDEPAIIEDETANLLAFSWGEGTFRAGGRAVGSLVWQSDNHQIGGAEIELRLVDWLGRSAAETVTNLGPAIYPPEQWESNEKVQQNFTIELPFSLEGPYRLQLKMPTGRWQTIGQTRIEGWPKLLELPDGIAALETEYRLDGQIELLAYTGTVDGSNLNLTFYWRSPEMREANYVVFIHVAEAGQAPLAQTSSGPAGWIRPVYTWRPDEIIVDSHTVTLPPEAAGSLGVWVGMFQVDDANSRLPLTGNGQSIPNGLIPLGSLADLGR